MLLTPTLRKTDARLTVVWSNYGSRASGWQEHLLSAQITDLLGQVIPPKQSDAKARSPRP